MAKSLIEKRACTNEQWLLNQQSRLTCETDRLYNTVSQNIQLQTQRPCQCTCNVTPHILRKSPNISVAFCVFVVNNSYFPKVTICLDVVICNPVQTMDLIFEICYSLKEYEISCCNICSSQKLTICIFGGITLTSHRIPPRYIQQKKYKFSLLIVHLVI